MQESNISGSQIYFRQKRKTIAYKLLFLLLATLFGCFALFINSSSVNWSSMVVFGSTSTVKEFVYLMCFPLAFFSLLIGSFLTPEREALFHMTSNARKTIERKYRKGGSLDTLDYHKSLAKLDELIDTVKGKIGEARKKSSIQAETEMNQALHFLAEGIDSLVEPIS